MNFQALLDFVSNVIGEEIVALEFIEYIITNEVSTSNQNIHIHSIHT